MLGIFNPSPSIRTEKTDIRTEVSPPDFRQIEKREGVYSENAASAGGCPITRVLHVGFWEIGFRVLGFPKP